MCVCCVLSVMKWHRPLAVICVFTMAGVSDLSMMVMQCVLVVIWASRGSNLL